MQDRFVGDVGDFGKYGLLRWLCGDSDGGWQLRLGVIWYYVETNAALPELGQPFNYLEIPSQHEQRLIQCDPELYGILQNLINDGQRSVMAMQNSGALSDGTMYYRDSVNAPLARDGWFTRAMHEVGDRDLVFLDPDNGLADTPDVEHATHGEAARLWEMGKSLVIYQHFNRDGTHEEQIHRHAVNLRRELNLVGPSGEIVALRFNRLPPRVFFVIPNSANEEVPTLLYERVNSFMDSCWGRGRNPHFTCVDV